MVNKCQGCGAVFQFTNPGLAGYIEKEVIEKSPQPLCKRCFRTKHYNDVASVEIVDYDYHLLFKKIKKEKSIVVLVVDLFNLDHTTLLDFKNYFKDIPLIIIANKYDLFSHVVTKEKLMEYLENYFTKLKYSYLDILIYSAFSTQDAFVLQNIIQSLEKYPELYFIGASNVGKSSILNQLLKINDEQALEITTSNFYQTTIGDIKLQLFNKNIIDTPGIVLNNSFTNYLNKKTLEKITPKKPLKPKVYQLNPEQTIFINNFILLNFLAGTKTTFVFYCENNLYLHRTKSIQACDAYVSLRKTLLNLPTEEERSLLGKRITTRFKVEKDRKQDIVFPGLGFVSIIGDVVLEVVHYENIKVYVRDALI